MPPPGARLRRCSGSARRKRRTRSAGAVFNCGRSCADRHRLLLLESCHFQDGKPIAVLTGHEKIPAGGIRYGKDRDRSDLHAVIGEHGINRGQFRQRNVRTAERKRQIRAERARDAEIVGIANLVLP